MLLLLLACAPNSPDSPGQSGDSGVVVPVDADGDGVPAADDCDDSDPAVFPGAPEQCNEADDDCDGAVDEGTDRVAWYRDLDGDGYGDPDDVLVSCLEQAGRVRLGTDCDDLDPTIHPGAAEVCDEVDQDCDGAVDEDLPQESFWLDQDEDGWGDPAGEVEACAAPEGFVSRGEDCDDDDPTVHPGAEEDWTDEVDGDCDGDIERAAPATLAGADEVQLALAEAASLRVISSAGATARTVHVDLSQPTWLVLASSGKVAWTVEDPGGVLLGAVVWTEDERTTVDGVDATWGEVTATVQAGLGAVSVDDPRTLAQLHGAAALDLDGDPTLASWHGLDGGEETVHLVEDPDWRPEGPWPWCEGLIDEAPITGPDPGALDCPDLGETVCLTATASALVAFDTRGATCTVSDLPGAATGATLRWSGDAAFLTTGPEGVLTRVELSTGEHAFAWRWPEAVLASVDGLVLIPGADLVDVDPDIAYVYDHWADLQCGGGANLVGRWGEDLTVSALDGGAGWWWTEADGLQRRDLRTDEATALDVDLSGVTGLDVRDDGRVWVLADGVLWTVDPDTETAEEVVDVGVEGVGLDCSGS